MINPAQWENFSKGVEQKVSDIARTLSLNEKRQFVAKLQEAIKGYLEADLENRSSLPDVVTKALRDQSNLDIIQKSRLHDSVTRLTVISFSPLLTSKKPKSEKAGV